MFLYKNQFLLIFSFLSIPIELWESTAAIFRQSVGYVFLNLTELTHQFLSLRNKFCQFLFLFFSVSIPMYVKPVNDCNFPAKSRLCFKRYIFGPLPPLFCVLFLTAVTPPLTHVHALLSWASESSILVLSIDTKRTPYISSARHL